MALKNTRAGNYPEWYQNVVSEADMAENSSSPGCMVIKPWGYGIWERIRDVFDEKIKSTDHENCYFPMFIPLSFFQKEAEHVDGFAKEMAVVTHSRLSMKDGKLVPDSELDEPLIVRPTSEAIIADSFSKWVKSYRDLPVLVNQWANVVRWEMRPRLFLRTREFLWQEGHTAHATAKEAEEETTRMLEAYRELCEDTLAMPVICGRKPEHEKFPGAVDTYCVEAMMQDGKALQAGTSHFLGQNFAKSANISFVNKNNQQEYAYTSSWGVSTRLIGGVIMTHADDEGMVVPPKIAPYQIVIVPVIKNDAPVILEIGPSDVAEDNVMVKERLRLGTPEGKAVVKRDEFVRTVAERLEKLQKEMFAKARARLEKNVRTDIKTKKEFEEYFANSNVWIEEGKAGKVAFVRGKWNGDPNSEELLKAMKITIRCIPFDQSGTKGECLLTGKQDAEIDVIYARSY